MLQHFNIHMDFENGQVVFHKRKIFQRSLFDVLVDTFDQRREADYDVEEKSFKKAKRVLDKTERIFNSIIKEFGNEKP